MELINMTLPTGAKVTVWLHSESPELTDPRCACRPAVVVCPGGGYAMLSGREKDPTAAEFFNMGAQVLVLEYSVGDLAGAKRPLEEAARAVLLARQKADAWRIDPNRIAIIGFSAGGHLAGSLGVHWDDPEIAGRLGVADAELLRPDAMILCYPVITGLPGLRHEGSIINVSARCDEPLEYWCLETQVKENTPPTFLWHTMEDTCVPVENSILMMSALHGKGVSCEAHFYPHGDHGRSMCTAEVENHDPIVRTWVPMCRAWLDETLGGFIGAY